MVRGEPTPEQLAALLVVVGARATAVTAAGDAPPARPLWGRPLLRSPLHPAPGAWRASALPR
ncbi:MAG: acyl-CoA carboxylase subunit epsilon [Mycobacteriales bacterium]